MKTPKELAHAHLLNAQYHLGEAAAQLAVAGLGEEQAEASRLYDAVRALDLDVEAVTTPKRITQ